MLKSKTNADENNKKADLAMQEDAMMFCMEVEETVQENTRNAVGGQPL